MNSGGHEQRPRPLTAIDGRQYPRKPPMYIDVLGLSTVTEAVHEASTMLRIGIMQAMAKGIENDYASTENPDRQKIPTEASQIKVSQTPEKDNISVYSSVTKRARRPIPAATDASVQELNLQHSRDSSSAAQRGSFAPRSWSATKKAGPSILSKRNRSGTANGNPGSGAASLSPFQPGPKREKHSLSKDTTTTKASQPKSNKQIGGSESAMGERSSEQLSTGAAAKDETSSTDPARNVTENSFSGARGISRASRQPLLKKVKAGTVIKDKIQSQSDIMSSEPASLSPSTRKVGLPPSWCQVSAKSFISDAATQSTSALSQLRNSGAVKQRPLPAVPRASGALPLTQAGKASLLPPKSEKAVSENRGLIPLPSSTGTKVKYVPGSEIIDGVRPNGYTVSIDGVVKPVVTFNPKPKLPHKLRQTSVEKLFEAWRDNRRVAEGDALARALRSEQEMYARASSRADYRAAVTVKLKDIRKLEN